MNFKNHNLMQNEVDMYRSPDLNSGVGPGQKIRYLLYFFLVVFSGFVIFWLRRLTHALSLPMVTNTLHTGQEFLSLPSLQGNWPYLACHFKNVIL